MKGEPQWFHYGEPNHWVYECSQVSENERAELRTTKEKGRCTLTKVSELIEYNEDSKNGIYMLVNQKVKQCKK